MKIERPWRGKHDPDNNEPLKQLLIDVLGVLLLGAGLPLLVWYFVSQDLSELADFFRYR